MPGVRVNRNAADRVHSGHLWIFAGDILDRGSAQPGDAVRVIDYQGRTLGTAHFSSTSQIALRLLSRRIEQIDQNFLLQRMKAALAFRQRIVAGSDAYRLIHAEGDLLPALVVDRYADWVAVQSLDQGMDRAEPDIVNVLTELLQPLGIVARNDVAIRRKENLAEQTKVLAGDVPDRVPIHMNGLTLHAELLTGQKTGVFLDQRENYMAARRYARGRALDCFTGTGGFALHVAPACEHVEAVDSSAASLDTARANAQLNLLQNITFHQADVLEYLRSLVSARRTFDLIIVDPPAFTKSRSTVEGAARGYKEINLRALRLLSHGGVLLTCSCSHHMTEAHLLGLIAAAALDCGKTLRVLERRTQSQDHPILLTVPETHYLKCLIFEAV